MKQLFFCLTLLFSTQTFSQKVFFTSSQPLSKEDMNTFYSSVTVEGDWILFNANDYKLYAYHKDGSPAWQASLNRKSNTPPFIVGNSVLVTASEKNYEYVQELDLQSGKLIKRPDLGRIDTKPVLRNGILYATGISNYGCVFAYDLKTDSLLWERFLAHGCSREPYYQQDKIIANAEGDSWLEIGYDGKLLDAGCEDSTIRFPSGLRCAKKFNALTHDGLAIKGKQSEKWLDADSYEQAVIHSGARHTFILQDTKLVIIGNKLKQKASIDLSSLSDNVIENSGNRFSILKADGEKLWLTVSNQLLVYSHQKKKLEREIDLSAWEPHQAVLDEDKLWLISKKDGLLYGISIL